MNLLRAAVLNIDAYYLLNSYGHILKLEVVVPDSLSKCSDNQQTEFRRSDYLLKAVEQIC